jgi:hypothetical protein
MKKFLILSMVLVSFVSCKKEDIILKEDINLDLIGCQCNDGTLVFRTNDIQNDIVVWTNIDKNVNTDICIKSLTKTEITIDACNRTIGQNKKQYSHGGIKQKFPNTSKGKEDWLKIVFTYPRATDNQTIWLKPNSVKPSVQCSGTTLNGVRCKNITTNCGGRCYLH